MDFVEAKAAIRSSQEKIEFMKNAWREEMLAPRKKTTADPERQRPIRKEQRPQESRKAEIKTALKEMQATEPETTKIKQRA
jgi:hypothetical protein